jgi:hypothetical protein
VLKRLFIIGAACGLAAVLLGVLVPTEAPARAAERPRNTAPPTIDDTTPTQGQRLRATTGTWAGTTPIAYSYRWRRCNPVGTACIDIATGSEYTVRAVDVGFTLRVRVTARNVDGSRTAASAATAPVAPAPPAPPPGSTIPVTSVNLPDRLVVDQVAFTPSPIRSRTAPIIVRVRVKDTRGFVISGALVFIRSVPLVTTTPAEGATGSDGVATFSVAPRSTFSLVFRRGFNLPFFVRARKPGDNTLAGVSARRLVQVRIAPR